MTVPDDIQLALRRYKARLEALFGSRLRRVSLFGSRARGDAHGDSDVDVLVLIDGCTFAEDQEATQLVADVDLETGVWLSPKVYATERFDHLLETESPFATAVRRDEIQI